MALIKKILFAVGIVLVGLNLFDVFLNLRNDDIYYENIENKFGIEFSEVEFYNKLNYIFDSALSDSAKIVATTDLVNKGIAHYWRDEGIDKYNLTIPIYENYLLWLSSYIYPNGFKKYEFINYRKAIERGVGLCSQHAIIQSEILRENGIDSKIIGLSGHVVATAEYSPNRWIIVDPDYGVNIPFNIESIQSNTELIENFYYSEGYDSSIVANLQEFFKPEGNRISNDVFSYSILRSIIEKISYLLIWIIPIFLIIPYMKTLLRRHRIPVGRSR